MTAVNALAIDSGCCDVMDRSYVKFTLFNAIVAKQSSYVCRIRDNGVHEVVTEQPFTEADRAANVLSNQVVLLGQKQN